ncbi:flippase-like domain-containing protein [Chroococcidiopsis sp. FACHB-1243]|uniref:lysylphosphatidylglycerol synthase domain-containing protein n=1 Tax=Chroococcidiopsis sp. [FACHB-1243] TaxID=2692781 RepID=UPI00177D34CA|nr:lysylphosphatidylglycerol synthase domain-containing protein [Chroococcidiopsis sp. [FACHB-1243]]MBD2308494.1 flippase-like domain-containing protein [Chroococcidiopsis sp. [FACHB-1243]]
MQHILSRLKPYLRWIILGGTLFFLITAFKNNWQEVAAIRIATLGWLTLATALGVTLLAHIWSGWVWTWILEEFNQTVNIPQFVRVYLQTNIAKYLPGNVWHYYGRISAAKTAGIPTRIAALSVLLEPLLMAAAAIVLALLGIQSTIALTQSYIQLLLFFVLAGVLLAIHPHLLNLAMRLLSRMKFKSTTTDTSDRVLCQIKRYPWRPLLGELGFVGLRGTGFLLTLLAIIPLSIERIPLLFAAFSLAWVLGLVIPGAPGGLGVFEVTAIALLQHSFSVGAVISAIALYRFISITAEAAGAGLAWLNERSVVGN